MHQTSLRRSLAAVATDHAAIVALIAGSLAAGFAVGFLGALTWLMWLAAFAVMLPVIRFVGEAGEHRYSGSATVFEATMTNDGWIHHLLIHPHNDSYHLAHHRWPGVPHHGLRKLHRLLLEADPIDYAQRYRRRTRILQEPTTSTPMS